MALAPGSWLVWQGLAVAGTASRMRQLLFGGLLVSLRPGPRNICYNAVQALSSKPQEL